MKKLTNEKFIPFGKEAASNYDKNIQSMAPLYKNLHFLIKALFSDLPANANILSIGTGTGTEIIELASHFPQFTFTAVEPSTPMWSVFQSRISELNLSHRVSSINAYIEDVQAERKFDAALCLLVLHHTPKDEREKIISGVFAKLKEQGLFIVAEMSPDEANSLINQWQSLVRLSGAPEEKVKSIPEVFREHLHMLSATEAEELLSSHGFGKTVQFFQSMLMRAWICEKA